MSHYSTTTRIHTSYTYTSPTHPAVTPSAVVKAAIVNALGFILALRPTIAMRLGKLVAHVWRGFGRA